MATIISPDEFIRAVAKSGIVSDDKLRESISKIKKKGKASDASTIADSMVEDEALTRWQADNILQGKYRNFFLGKYRLLSLIGKGGMGAVYLAEHTMLNRRCAIKVLPGALAKNKDYIERFMREAQAVAAMDHPNIVRAYDVDKDVNDKREMYYLTMEYVQGKDVDEFVKEKGLPDFVQAADIIRQTAEGLDYAHQQSLVHRDIKPANLLLTGDGVVKILDLGLARNFDDDDAASLTAAQNATYLGTPDYLAPEQAIDCHDVDGRADIYSLGCSLYFLLTGNPPFGEGTIAQRLIAHQTKKPTAIRKLRPDAPQELIDIAELMMEKDRDDRYQTAKEVANALAGWLVDNAGDDWIEKNPAAVSTADGGVGVVDELEEIDDNADAFDDLETLAAASMQSAASTSGLGQAVPGGRPMGSGVVGPSGSSVGPMKSPLAQTHPGMRVVKKQPQIPMWAIVSGIAGGAVLLIGIVVLVIVFAFGSDSDDPIPKEGLAQVNTPDTASPTKTTPANSQKKTDTSKEKQDKGKQSQSPENSHKGSNNKDGGKKNGKNSVSKNTSVKNVNPAGTGRVADPPTPRNRNVASASIPFSRYEEGDLAFASKWLVPFGVYAVEGNKGIDKSKALVFSDHGMYQDSELRREFAVPSGGTLILTADIQITTAKSGLPSGTVSPFAMFIGTSGLDEKQRTQAGLSRVSNGTFDLNGYLPLWERKNVKAEQLGLGKGNDRTSDWLRVEFQMTRLPQQDSLQGSMTVSSLGKDGKQTPKEIAKQTSAPGNDRKDLWNAKTWAVGFTNAQIKEAAVDEVAVDNFSVKVLTP